MKSEVRFKFPKEVRSLIIHAVRDTLSQNGLKSNSALRNKTLESFSSYEPVSVGNNVTKFDRSISSSGHLKSEQIELYNKEGWLSGKVEPSREADDISYTKSPLGVAKAQLHKNFIVSQSSDGLILVDQHAAHERITYEKLKKQYVTKKIESQSLLIPEIIDLLGNEKEVILHFSETLLKIGFEVEAFGENAICLRGVPALLGLANLKDLIIDLVDELLVCGQVDSIEARVDAVISRISCHGSIRSGRQLNAEEMNHLLRQMEATPFSAQCNHGRPTFVELKLSDIQKLFGRT